MPGELAEDTVLTSDQMVRHTMYSALDHLHNEIASRSNRLTSVSKKFNFLLNFDSDVHLAEAMSLWQTIPIFFLQSCQKKLTDLKVLVKLETNASVNADFLMEQVLAFGPNAFPNMLKAIKILLTTAVSVASCERSLKILAKDHRSSMKQDQLSALAILSIESELTTALSEQDVLNEFFSKKRGRGGLNSKL